MQYELYNTYLIYKTHRENNDWIYWAKMEKFFFLSFLTFDVVDGKQTAKKLCAWIC